jgi:hypothetical protein
MVKKLVSEKNTRLAKNPTWEYLKYVLSFLSSPGSQKDIDNDGTPPAGAKGHTCH